uniref:NAD(+) kinase n=1 Tax=Timema monikensis TaxID=170555 RepID=A0A7R9HLH3_9NEOP|nr:unnamed protein product [Timema monikensis]
MSAFMLHSRRHFLGFLLGCHHYSSSAPSLKLNRALLVSKLSRYELESLRFKDIDQTQLEKKLRNRGSDYELLIHHHEVHKSFEKSVIDVLKNKNVDIRLVPRLCCRFKLTQDDISWADVIFSLGGDGTFLMVASSVLGNSKPVVGFNSDPTRSEGHLCLPKRYSTNLEEAIYKLTHVCDGRVSDGGAEIVGFIYELSDNAAIFDSVGEFKWMFRSRIRITLSGEFIDEQPVELQEELLHPDRRIYNCTAAPVEKRVFIDSALPESTRVLPVFALNEVFLGESLSARVSYFELSLDGGPFTKIKSSGLCVTTGTGSTSWHLSINRVDQQTVAKLAALLGNKLSPEQVPAITKSYNDSLVFSPENPQISYTIRDNICASVWPHPKGIESRGFASQIIIRSRCFDAVLVIDGRVSFKFNDGTVAKLEIHESDSLRTVILNE